MWAGPNTEWLKECDIKLALSGKIYERPPSNTRVRCCLQNKRKLPMALIGSSARTRPTERARVRHGARTLSWPRDARATSLRALTRAVTLDQRRAPHSLLSRSPQPAPIAKLSLCENTGSTRYAGSRKERGEALRDSRAFCESCDASFAHCAFLPKANSAAPKMCSPQNP